MTESKQTNPGLEAAAARRAVELYGLLKDLAIVSGDRTAPPIVREALARNAGELLAEIERESTEDVNNVDKPQQVERRAV